jgi:hypothetical protein
MTPEQFDAILEDVRSGTAVRRAIAKQPISPNDFYKLCDRDLEARDRYRLARDAMQDAIFDEMLEISDTVEIGEIVTTTEVPGKDGKMTKQTKRETRDLVERAKVKLETRRWFLKVTAPQKYGDKLDVDQRVEHVMAKEIEERLNDGRKRLALVK